MKKSITRFSAILTVLVLIFSVAFVGCGTSRENTLVISIYGNYYSDDAAKLFEEEFGCKVEFETFEACEEMYQKLIAGAADYDLICCGDYMIERLIQEKLLKKLNLSNIPNTANLNEIYTEKSKNFDPGLEYSIPHFWGTLGLLYNTKTVDPAEAQSWNVLWNKKYEGRIYMINSARDILVPALSLLGYSINTVDEKEIDEAKQLLIKQAPLTQGYSVDDTKNQIVSGNADIGIIYSGESYNSIKENPDLAYVIPKEGSNIWIDSWVIPTTCQNKELAEKFIDFSCRGDIAKLNFDIDYYPTPNNLLYESLDKEIRNNPCIFPSSESLSICETFHYTGKEAYTLYDNALSEILSSAS